MSVSMIGWSHLPFGRHEETVEEMVKTYPWMTLVAIKRRVNKLRDEARHNGLDIPALKSRPKGRGRRALDWDKMKSRHGLPKFEG